MTPKLKSKLAKLPREPGVYFFRDAKRKIIYIGKAAILKSRVSSYFQKTVKDPKTTLLIAEIADLDWITVDSEVEALFLESEFIKRYKPRYNIDWKDEKNFIYVKITTQENFPVVSYVRRPMDDRATYFGPFTSADALRRAMRMLRKVFPYVTHETMPVRGCLQFHLGLCPGPEEGAISSKDYKRSNVRNLILYLSGQRDKLTRQIERSMQRAARQKDFETAARARDQLRYLRALHHKMVFGDREAFDLSLDQALVGLVEHLKLAEIPRRIEAYDISNVQGQDAVASMIVFNDGMPNRDEYRRFRMRIKGPDDFAMIREVISRRFSPSSVGRPKDWPKPDLILIDGGKGQLSSALSILDEKNIRIPTVGLAKRQEEIIRRAESGSFETTVLPHSSPVLQLLQRIRDEAHRFAINYHALLRSWGQTKSGFDDIPGVGPATRKKLLKAFGSFKGVREAPEQKLTAVVGPAKTRVIKEHLG